MKLNEEARKADQRTLRENNIILKKKLQQERRDVAAKAKEARIIAQAQKRAEIDERKAEQQRKKIATQAKNTTKLTTKGKRKALDTIPGNTKRRHGDAGGLKAVAPHAPAPPL